MKALVARFFVATFTLLLCNPASASLPPGEIVQRSLDRMALRARGAVMTMVMHLKEQGGTPLVRTFHAKARKRNEEARTLVRFLTPSDVAGTAFLFVQRSGVDDKQYMYLPALRSVRRIVGRQKQGRFMGSDFSYADLEWRDMREARYKKHPDQNVGSEPCHVIDSIPHERGEYGYVRSWIRKRDLVPIKVKFYDHRKRLLKIMFVKRLSRVEGKLMITELKMVTKRTGHSTLLKLKNITLRRNLPERAFSMRALRGN